MKKLKDAPNTYRLVDRGWLMYLYNTDTETLFITNKDENLSDKYIKYGLQEARIQKVIDRVEKIFKRVGASVVDIITDDPAYYAIFELEVADWFDLYSLEDALEAQDEKNYNLMNLDEIVYPAEAYLDGRYLVDGRWYYPTEIDMKDTSKVIFYIEEARRPRTLELETERRKTLDAVDKQGKKFCTKPIEALAAIDLHGNSFVFFNSTSPDTEVHFIDVGETATIEGDWLFRTTLTRRLYDFYSAIRFTDGSAFAISKEELQDFIEKYNIADPEDYNTLEALEKEIL